jgi:hypothetical protein
MTRTHLPLRHAVRALVPDATGNPADGFVYAAGPEEAMDSPYVGTVVVVLAAAALAGLAPLAGDRWRRTAPDAPARHAGDPSRHADAPARHAGDPARHPDDPARHADDPSRHADDPARHPDASARHAGRDAPALTPLLLPSPAARAGDRRTVHVVALVACSAVVALLAFTGPPHLLLRVALPGYDRFRGAARWTSMLPVAALPLAALGLDALRAGDRRARRWALGAAVAGLVVIAGWLVRELAVPTAPHAYLARRGALAAGILAVAILAVLRPRLTGAAAVACVAVELAVAVCRWYPDVREHGAYPPVPALAEAAARGGRLARTGPGGFPMALPPDVPMAYGVADVSALTPLFPADWERYLRLVADHGATVRELNVAPAVPAPALASPLLVAADVRTVVGSRGTVVQRRPGLPAAVVPRADPATRASAWRALARPGWDPRRRAAVEGLDRPVRGGPGTATALPAPGPDHERWRVVAPDGGFLRVSGRWDRGWRATVDGRPVPVLRADAVFRGVVVPPGAHTVSFRYRNPVEHAGRWVASAGLAALAALVALAARPAIRPFWHQKRH